MNGVRMVRNVVLILLTLVARLTRRSTCISFRSVSLSTALCSAFVLSSCGGGGGGGSQDSTAVATTAPAIVLPPSSGSADMDTLLGKDVNQNGVRDEVEIAMSRSIGNDIATWTAMIQLAQLYQSWLANPTTDRSIARARLMAEAQAVSCLQKTSGRSVADAHLIVTELGLRTFTTRDRQKVMSDLAQAAGAFQVPTSLTSSC